MARKAYKNRGHVMISARGKTAHVVSDPTKVIGRRGKRVAVNKKQYAVSVGERQAKVQEAKGGKVIRRRGKKVAITKRVRSI